MTDRICGCLSCRSDARYVVDHPDHGRRTVCDEHAAGYDVLERLGGGVA